MSALWKPTTSRRKVLQPVRYPVTLPVLWHTISREELLLQLWSSPQALNPSDRITCVYSFCMCSVVYVILICDQHRTTAQLSPMLFVP